ncbi:MAG: hypothetical protein LQ338_008098 [Usnochroma carphineum]|nr:MAG: hypothetical protein LQ338_008098 [Usnochroma carphineum]
MTARTIDPKPIATTTTAFRRMTIATALMSNATAKSTAATLRRHDSHTGPSSLPPFPVSPTPRTSRNPPAQSGIRSQQSACRDEAIQDEATLHEHFQGDAYQADASQDEVTQVNLIQDEAVQDQDTWITADQNNVDRDEAIQDVAAANSDQNTAQPALMHGALPSSSSTSASPQPSADPSSETITIPKEEWFRIIQDLEKLKLQEETRGRKASKAPAAGSLPSMGNPTASESAPVILSARSETPGNMARATTPLPSILKRSPTTPSPTSSQPPPPRTRSNSQRTVQFDPATDSLDVPGGFPPAPPTMAPPVRTSSQRLLADMAADDEEIGRLRQRQERLLGEADRRL